jgi:small subunit ribosomal protein S18
MSKRLKIKISARILKKKLKKQSFGQKRQCRFLTDPTLVKEIDYKNVKFLESFLTESCKILPSRISGNSALYQRMISNQIKIARSMALLPYCLWSK